MKTTTIQTALALAALGLAAAQDGGDRAAPVVPIQPIMGSPLDGLTASELDRFETGSLEFNHSLLESEGLGPGFNDVSCAQCHAQPRAGGFATTSVIRFGKAASGGNAFDPLEHLGGSLLQERAIDPSCIEVVPPEADVTAERITPHLFGLGLVEAIPDADLLALANTPPHPNVAGTAHMVTPLEGGPVRVGRLGWKSQLATVLSFSADASMMEMGLTNRLIPFENAPNGDFALLAACDNVADPEDGPDLEGFDRIDRQTDFQRLLAPPPQTPKTGMTGEALFEQVSCDACHVSSFTTGSVAEAALSGVTFQPYSDFLLHDVVGDGIVQGAGTETKMRTAPLWGLSGRAGAAMLHDGRVTGSAAEDNIHAAILAHDGEAAFSRDAYLGLTSTEQSQIADFLLSLGRAEFDLENNATVDEFDWFFLWASGHFTGPAPSGSPFFTPDDDAAVADIDVDGDFDMVDFAAMQRAFTGQLP